MRIGLHGRLAFRLPDMGYRRAARQLRRASGTRGNPWIIREVAVEDKVGAAAAISKWPQPIDTAEFIFR
jgi:hypothetical protein